MSERPLLSIVIPAYREEKNLAVAVERIRAVVEPLGTHEFVIVDDGSPDGTWEAMQDLTMQCAEVRAVRLSRNFGKEAAMNAGVARAQGRAIIMIDADLQHPPELIPEMVAKWRQGYDVVNAVKRERQTEGPVKTALTNIYYKVFSRLVGFDLTKASDFKLLDRQAADTYATMPERHVFFRGLTAWMGYRQTDVLFDVDDRHAGETTWSPFRLMALAMNSIICFSTLPMHLMTALGVVFGVVSTAMAVQTFGVWLSGEAVPGFATVILLLIFIGSILMVGLGIIGAYVAKIYEEVKGRPRFIIDEEVMGRAAQASLEDGRDQMDRSARVAARAL